jgi:hypothetical protein
MPSDSDTAIDKQSVEPSLSSSIDREGQLFGLGNPLLDITSAVTDEFLDK